MKPHKIFLILTTITIASIPFFIYCAIYANYLDNNKAQELFTGLAVANANISTVLAVVTAALWPNFKF